MTISSITRSAGPYAGTGSQVIFSFAFKVFANTDMAVTLTNPSGVDTALVLTTDYTVALNADQNANPGGTITTTVAPAVGYTLTMTSQVPNLQPTDIANVGNFYPKAVTDAFDRATIQIQQLALIAGNSLKKNALGTAWDFKNLPGFNLADPTNPQDVTNLRWVQNYISSVLSTGSGTPNVAANVLYVYPDTVPRSLQTLATKGNNLLGSAGIAHKNATVRDYLPVYFDDFGTVGTSDDTTVMQAALNSGLPIIVAKAGTTYTFTTLTMSTNGQAIKIEPNATLYAKTPTARSITISGVGCSIFGGGTILGFPTFDGANVRPTYATLWVTGNYFSLVGITMDTTPKEALMFEDSTYHRVLDNHFIGRYPYGSYDENSTTNQSAIMLNIPPLSLYPDPYINIVGNTIEQYIQGCLLANYDAAGNNNGIMIAGNNFKDLWDHGVYLSRSLGAGIVGNNFLGCRRPIVCDGINSLVVGNVLDSGDTTTKSREQYISMREASNCVVANNSIKGYDAGILCDCIETVTMNGNLIANNSMFSMGVANLTCGIRLGVGATQCDDNAIIGNSINSAYLGTSGAGIQLLMASGAANRTRVQGNHIVRGDAGGYGIQVDRHAYCDINNNMITFSASAGGATSTSGLFISNSTFPTFRDNQINYTAGGTNITFTAVNVQASCAIPKVWYNRFNCTAAFAAAFIPYNLGTQTDVLGNLLNPNYNMAGSFTWGSGVSSFVVTNSNCLPGSYIEIIPVDNGAAAVMRDLGFFVTSGVGGFTIATAGAVNTAGVSNWRYVIV